MNKRIKLSVLLAVMISSSVFAAPETDNQKQCQQLLANSFKYRKDMLLYSNNIRSTLERIKWINDTSELDSVNLLIEKEIKSNNEVKLFFNKGEFQNCLEVGKDFNSIDLQTSLMETSVLSVLDDLNKKALILKDDGKCNTGSNCISSLNKELNERLKLIKSTYLNNVAPYRSNASQKLTLLKATGVETKLTDHGASSKDNCIKLIETYPLLKAEFAKTSTGAIEKINATAWLNGKEKILAVVNSAIATEGQYVLPNITAFNDSNYNLCVDSVSKQSVLTKYGINFNKNLVEAINTINRDKVSIEKSNNCSGESCNPHLTTNFSNTFKTLNSQNESLSKSTLNIQVTSVTSVKK